MRALLAPLAALALLAAAPTPSPSPTGPVMFTVICQRAHFYVFTSITSIPHRAHTPDATQGQRYGAVGDRTTLQSVEYVETNIPVTDPGYPPDAHFWLQRVCVSID
jgi:hypothetical protein